MLPLQYLIYLYLTDFFQISVSSHAEVQQGLVPSKLVLQRRRVKYLLAMDVNYQLPNPNVSYFLLLRYTSIYH
jgi:hypothetical protein